MLLVRYFIQCEMRHFYIFIPNWIIQQMYRYLNHILEICLDLLQTGREADTTTITREVCRKKIRTTFRRVRILEYLKASRE